MSDISPVINSGEPSAVIVLCGKRKSGKDYVAAQLQQW